MRQFPFVFFYFFVLAATVIFLFSSYLNSKYWLVTFAAIFTPLIFICNLLFLSYWILTKKYILVFLSLLLFLFGFPFLRKTFALNFLNHESPDFKVLSYNVGTFNLKRYNRIMDTITPPLMIKWFAENKGPDIICLQEFYNNGVSGDENTLEGITNEENPYYYYTNPIFWDDMNGFFGVITFSRFPIINRGPLIFGDSSNLNRGVFTDLVIKSDTVRVLNVHLRSMTIRLDTSDTFLPFRALNNAVDIAIRLKKGIQGRNKEIDFIMDFVKNSPYPVILCGDFNDTPYSYTYHKVTDILQNSFESAGNGFGFTYNRFPWIIRIDNQFNSRRMEAVTFKVFHDNKFSDHFPIEAGYKFRK